jgi:hypothetical protein
MGTPSADVVVMLFNTLSDTYQQAAHVQLQEVTQTYDACPYHTQGYRDLKKETLLPVSARRQWKWVLWCPRAGSGDAKGHARAQGRQLPR